MSGPSEYAVEEKHLWDYVRVVYKRRWLALPAFLLVFSVMAFNSMRQTPIYRSQAQLLIEKDAPTVARLDQMFQSQEGWSSDEFYQTQYRILQSRSLAKRTVDQMKLWDAPKLGNGPEPKSQISPSGMAWGLIDTTVGLVKRPFKSAEPPVQPIVPEKASADESAVIWFRSLSICSGYSLSSVRLTVT